MSDSRAILLILMFVYYLMFVRNVGYLIDRLAERESDDDGPITTEDR